MIPLNTIGLFLFISGFVVGLGAVTVIDICGFLGRKSSYWTETTTRVHKVTKPLIWVGIFLVIIGSSIFYRNYYLENIFILHFVIIFILILNGLFLSFSVSPMLLEREKNGKSSEILSSSWQNKITFSFIISFLGWWSIFLILIMHLINN